MRRISTESLSVNAETPHPDADYLPLLKNSIKLLCCVVVLLLDGALAGGLMPASVRN